MVQHFSNSIINKQQATSKIWPLPRGLGPFFTGALQRKNTMLFFRNSISATRSIMNQLFVVVLSRFRILVRVGPERRGATNKYLW